MYRNNPKYKKTHIAKNLPIAIVGRPPKPLAIATNCQPQSRRNARHDDGARMIQPATEIANDFCIRNAPTANFRQTARSSQFALHRRALRARRAAQIKIAASVIRLAG